MNSHPAKQPDGDQTPAKRFKVFRPILAGGNLRDRLIGSFGALIGICLTGLICALTAGGDPMLPLIVAPIGASAVLLFAVPASPLAQPWAIIGGNTVSAFVGVAVAHFVPDPRLAIGIAVALAILAMSLTRSLHPPGGAAALTAVIGGAAVAKLGFWFPLLPVALNSVLLVVLGIIFHRLCGRKYPHRAAPAPVNQHKTADVPAQLRLGFNDSDVDAVLAASPDAYDIDREDLASLLRSVEMQALKRQKGATLCGDIMSRDVISVKMGVSAGEARALLLVHNIRSLPVTDDQDRLLGTIGLRELAALEPGATFAPSVPAIARPEDSAVALLPRMTDGSTHAIVIIDADQRVIGIISQTDLLATLARSLSLSHSTGLVVGSGHAI